MGNYYNIKAVARRTGLTTFCIRAWESRYGAIAPCRTESNRRLYCDSDIEKLTILTKLTQSGHNIGTIANLNIEELKELLIDEKEKISRNPDQEERLMQERETCPNCGRPLEERLSICLESMRELNAPIIENELIRASVEVSHPVLIDELIGPLVRKTGEMWRKGELRVYHEHFLTNILRNFIFNQMDSYSVPPSAPKIIMATPIGQYHELGILTASLISSSEGWEVIYLGASLPAEEIIAAAEQVQAKAIALSIVFPPDDLRLRKELSKFQNITSLRMAFIVGGQAVVNYKNILEEAGSIIINGIDDFRKQLQKIRETY